MACGNSSSVVFQIQVVSISAKTAWAKAEGLAGMAIWELSLDYFAGRSIVSPLLNTVKVSYPKLALTSVTPGTPAGLTAAGVTASSATSARPSPAAGISTIATVTAPGYTDATLTAGAAYYYAVSGLNNSSEGANSSQLAVAATAGTLRPLPRASA